jgi:hypothetical protein
MLSMHQGILMPAHKIHFVILSLLASLVTSGAVRAEVLLHDQFATDGPLATQLPSPGPGAAWNPGSGTGVNAVQVTGGQVALVQTDGGLNGEDIANVFADQPATATTFARFDFLIPSVGNETLGTDTDVTGEGVFFVTLRGTSANSTQRARFGVLGPTAGGDFRVAINADASDLSMGGIWSGDLEFDTTYRGVISYDALAGLSKLWINPTSEASTSVSDTGAAGTIINRIILRQADDYAGKQFVDNVVVATTFAEALSGGVTNFLEADFNQDGDVDGEDLAQWRLSFGADDLADADGDDDTDGEDFLIWQRQLGQTPPAALVAAAAIPEPGSLALAAAAVGLVAAKRRGVRTLSNR